MNLKSEGFVLVPHHCSEAVGSWTSSVYVQLRHLWSLALCIKLHIYFVLLDFSIISDSKHPKLNSESVCLAFLLSFFFINWHLQSLLLFSSETWELLLIPHNSSQVTMHKPLKCVWSNFQSWLIFSLLPSWKTFLINGKHIFWLFESGHSCATIWHSLARPWGKWRYRLWTEFPHQAFLAFRSSSASPSGSRDSMVPHLSSESLCIPGRNWVWLFFFCLSVNPYCLYLRKIMSTVFSRIDSLCVVLAQMIKQKVPSLF